MSENKPVTSFEDTLKDYFEAPEPRPGFLDGLEGRLLEQMPAARRPAFRLRPAFVTLAVALALLVAFIAVGPARVVAAIEGLLRYIPGYGLVSEETPVRALAQPVTVKLDDISVTVSNLVATKEKTGVNFFSQNVPFDAQLGGTLRDRGRICEFFPELRLADGTRLFVTGGGAGAYDPQNHYVRYYEFPALPAGVDEVSLYLPCLPETLTSQVPGGWTIPLRLVAAPQALAQLPVIALTPSAPAELSASALVLENVVETEDGYIFTGTFQPPQGTRMQPFVSTGMRFTDAAGKPLPFNKVPDLPLTVSDDGVLHWAYQVLTKNIDFPVTIRSPQVSVSCNDETASFKLDSGANPSIDQQWRIDQSFFSGACALRVLSARRNDNSYSFELEGIENKLTWAELAIPGYHYATGVLVGERKNPASKVVRIELAQFSGDFPTGDLTVTISGVSVELAGDWAAQWQP